MEEVAANSIMIGVGSLEIIFGIWMTVISARAIENGSKAQVGLPKLYRDIHIIMASILSYRFDNYYYSNSALE